MHAESNLSYMLTVTPVLTGKQGMSLQCSQYITGSLHRSPLYSIKEVLFQLRVHPGSTLPVYKLTYLDMFDACPSLLLVKDHWLYLF